MTVRIVQRIALNLFVVAGVIDNQVGLAVLCDGEAVVPGTVLVVGCAALENRNR